MPHANMQEKKDAFERLLIIMDELREQCPWDRKQTLESLRNLTIEETYELADAISKNDLKGIKEELGDILLHIVFYARIGNEQEEFDISDVIHQLCDKLIRRHPHIYGDATATTEDQVKANWEQIKLKEGKKSVFEGVPNGLPALIKALRLQDKSKQVGFEWENTVQVWAKVEEELQELKEATELTGADAQAKMEDEFGDVLFSLVNYARFINVDPENALERTNQKFMARFRYIEEQALLQQRSLKSMTLEEMDALWNEAKGKLASN